MKPSKQALAAAMKLMSPEMKPFLDWMEAERAEYLELAGVAKLDTVQVVQGQSQALKRVLEVVHTSRDVLDKLGA